MFYLYILESELDGSYYIGQTKNIENRLEEHNTNKNKYTRHKQPWKLIYKEEFQTRGEAIKRERYFKNLKNKRYISELIYRVRSSTVEQ